MIYRVYKYGTSYKAIVFKGSGLPTIHEESLNYDEISSLASWEIALENSFSMSAEVAKKEAKKLMYHTVEMTEKRANNLSRAKSKVVELALCNDFEYFVTLTLDCTRINRFDLPNFIKALGVWIGNYNKKYNVKLKYILIPEEHKKGGWHMHGLFSGIAPESLCVNEHGYLDLPYFRERFGFISLSPIKDKIRCARYITKYICKDMTARVYDVGNHLYYASHGLNKREFVIQGNVSGLPKDCYECEYVGLKWFENEEEMLKWVKK